jgi:site-specific DNA-adenine methylase
MKAPFPYFGGKRTIADTVWRAFGRPKQYIEPFCGSAAVLLSAHEPASLEVIGDANGFIANFWRAVVAQAEEVARAPSLRRRIENEIRCRKEAMLTAHPGGSHWRFSRDVAALLEQMLRDHNRHSG